MEYSEIFSITLDKLPDFKQIPLFGSKSEVQPYQFFYLLHY